MKNQQILNTGFFFKHIIQTWERLSSRELHIPSCSSSSMMVMISVASSLCLFIQLLIKDFYRQTIVIVMVIQTTIFNPMFSDVVKSIHV